MKGNFGPYFEENEQLYLKGLKRCRECAKVKTIIEFSKVKECQNGLRPVCKECRSTSVYIAVENLVGEEWKDIQDYEGLYQISNHGRVKSLKYWHSHHREQILILRKNTKGYFQARLCKEQKHKWININILVLTHFGGPSPDPKFICDHEDTNPENNHISNLRWLSRSGNAKNVLKKRKSISKYKGVFRVNRTYGHRWVAQIYIDGKQKYLGTFDTEEEAARAYDGLANTYGYYTNVEMGLLCPKEE